MKEATDPLGRIAALPIWQGSVEVVPLAGGITNRNWLATDRAGRWVVRLGDDIPVHGIRRAAEHAVSRAAAATGISPPVRHVERGLLVLQFVEGKTLGAADVRADLQRCVALVRRAHREIAPLVADFLVGGDLPVFDVFAIIRRYARLLHEAGSRAVPLLPGLLGAAGRLEAAVGAGETVLGHNDLLPSNFIDDGERLWLIDWDYAGLADPLFDLGGLASNSGCSPAEASAILAFYYGAPPDEGLLLRAAAMTCASLLRETLWSLVSEHHSAIDFDYVAYSDDNLARFRAGWATLEERLR